MQSEQGSQYPYTLFSSGVDWMTATAKPGSPALAFKELAYGEFEKEKAAGGNIKPAAFRGYAGLRGDGLYFGQRHDDSIIILSGPRSPPLFARVAQAATNVSRLDLQCSVWTHGEQPHLALAAYRTLQRVHSKAGRKPALTLIQSHPKGETCYVGKRTSDHYGRLYDWSTAHKAGQARTVWRYEVEWKRAEAKARARALLSDPTPATLGEQLVRSWWADRGIEPTWSSDGPARFERVHISTPERNPLAWFRDSVSVTAARVVNRYGIHATLDALGLAHLARPLREGETYDALTGTWSVPYFTHRGDTRADYSKRVPLSEQEYYSGD